MYLGECRLASRVCSANNKNIILGAALFILAQVLSAAPFQTPGDIDYIRDKQDKILEEQRKRIKELQDLPKTTLPTQPLSNEPDKRCFTINKVTLKGATLISTDRQQTLFAPFIGQCLGISQLNDVLKVVTNEYLNLGYVTSRAYLPEQDLARGELVIQVVEGKLEGFESSAVATKTELFMASPTGKGHVINLRELEQTVDQLNRLPSRSAEVELLPGKDIGSSFIQVKGQKTNPWHVNLTRHNDGQKSTGEQQWAASFLWDSPLGLADQFSLSGGGDAVSDHWKHSASQSINYSIPYGWWTFNYSYSQSYYRGRTYTDTGFHFDTDGTSKTHRLRAERVIHRDSVSKTAFNLGLSHLRTRNYIDNELIEVSSQRLSEFELGINHGRRIGNGYLNTDLSWQKGIGAFDAQANRYAGHGNPTARYNKYSLVVSYLYSFQMLGEYFSFENLANGQYSHDVLYSSQRISLGGSSSIRGFKDQSLSGDTGGYWRNQLRWRKAIAWEPLSKVFQEYGALFAYDVGIIRHGPYNPVYSGRMSSNAFEMSLSGQYLIASVTLARSLRAPNIIERKEHPIYFRLDMNF